MKKNQVIITVCIILFVLLVFAPLIYLIIEDMRYRDSKQLVTAIKSQDIEKVEELLQDGVDPNRLSGKANFFSGFVSAMPHRPLSRACYTGNIELIQLLIDYGATAEYNVDYYDDPPLYATLREYHPDDLQIVKLLLEHGADIYEPRQEHSPEPVFQAAGMLVNNNGVYDEEAAKGAMELVDFLLDGRSVNIRSESCGGTTLIISASLVGNRDLVEYLLSKGADPYIAGCEGKNAIDYATEHGYSDIVALITGWDDIQ